MRRLALLSVLVVVMAASCSSSEPLSFELARPQAPPPVAVTINGDAVDEGVVCSAGTFVGFQLEDLDGNEADMDDWGTLFEDAMANGTVAEVVNRAEFECSDGSGTITIVEHVRFDFAEIDMEEFFAGRISNGTWTLEGTGDYDSLTGFGDLISDNGAGMIYAVGEVKA
jgi:hypothetical protein